MADLNFLAAGVTDAEQWTRAEGTNPLVPVLRDSWKNRTKVGRGKQERTIGAAKALTVSSADAWATARSGILSAARALDMGVEIAYFGDRPVIGQANPDGSPFDPEQDDPDETVPVYGEPPKLPTIQKAEQFPGGNVQIRFRAKPARETRERMPADDTDTGPDTDEV